MADVIRLYSVLSVVVFNIYWIGDSLCNASTTATITNRPTTTTTPESKKDDDEEKSGGAGLLLGLVVGFIVLIVVAVGVTVTIGVYKYRRYHKRHGLYKQKSQVEAEQNPRETTNYEMFTANTHLSPGESSEYIGSS